MPRPPQRYHWLISAVTEHLASDKRDECLEWPFFRFPSGYGSVPWQDQNMRAHRVSYEHFVEKITQESPNVLHRCDNPPCFNPLHLFAGTGGDNARDRGSKGRTARGENIGLLSEADVILIRTLYHPGKNQEFNTYGLSERFGVNASTIQRIIRRETWTHI